ncbi:ATP synthase subunit O, mitochondrial-like [Coregonus clupeaformis]|uniref:ATP synthase subunit O, mitochondrial-like n=1 Tax=Coregonus clupeaformis TaxID=59861 RepID=UPI001BDFF6CA|nr:ATP synthase subunit O, mitochondrial-like [Coregonus clupeaformis]
MAAPFEARRTAALVKDPKLSGIMMNPHVKRSIKHTNTDVMTKTGMSPVIINLISGLSDLLTSDVISAFSKMMSAHRGEVICTVSTTHLCVFHNLKDLRVALNGFLARGETLELETKSDPSILGGLTVSIREKSTKTKIQKLTLGRPKICLRS